MSATTDIPASRGRPRLPVQPDDGSDSIREAIIRRVEELGYDRQDTEDLEELARQCDGSPNPLTIRRYLCRLTKLNSGYVSTLCRVLWLELREKS